MQKLYTRPKEIDDRSEPGALYYQNTLRSRRNKPLQSSHDFISGNRVSKFELGLCCLPYSFFVRGCPFRPAFLIGSQKAGITSYLKLFVNTEEPH